MPRFFETYSARESDPKLEGYSDGNFMDCTVILADGGRGQSRTPSVWHVASNGLELGLRSVDRAEYAQALNSAPFRGASVEDSG